MLKLKKNLIIAAIIIFGSFVVWAIYPGNHKVIQPISYSHKIHIEKADLRCIDCHLYYEQMSSATLPLLEVCTNCHSEEPISKSTEELKLIDHIKKGKEILWQRIYTLPDHIYFSHRRHIILGKLECVDCHGKVEEQSQPINIPFIKLTMNNCMNCHRKHKVTNDCLACHY
jgi:hypothetical protein